MNSISIFLVHRFQILVDLLSEALKDTPEIGLSGIASCPRQAIKRLRRLSVDIVLLETSVDFGTVDSTAGASGGAALGGVDFVRELKAMCPTIKILPFGLSSSQEIVDLLESGACGYVPSDASMDELLATVRLVNDNQSPCSSHIASSVLQRLQELSEDAHIEGGPVPSKKHLLTDKEQQVLRCLAKGLSNRAIGDQFRVSLSTVKMHVHHILGKLEVRNRRQAVRVALECELLD